ncbi:MAG: hypothetical protein JST54_15095 [Deltaproteobacteria bacterium]|nr:hypothetical protein [Deltaproteobacteria bacterium]
MPAYDPYTDPDIEEAMRDQLASRYKGQIFLGVGVALIFSSVAIVGHWLKAYVIGAFGVWMVGHGAFQWYRVRISRTSVSALRDSDISDLPLRTKSFALSAGGPAVVTVSWRQLKLNSPLRDVRVSYQGEEIARINETSLAEGEQLRLPDGKTLFLRVEPDFLAYRRMVASLEDAQLVSLAS